MSALLLVSLGLVSTAVMISGAMLGMVCVSVLHGSRRHPFAQHTVPLVLLTFSALMVLAGWRGLLSVADALAAT